MIVRTTVCLPADLLNRAKRRAAAKRHTLTSLIEEGLRSVLADSRKTVKRKRVLPRISKATGGLMPAIDLADLSALQEADDLHQLAAQSWDGSSFCETHHLSVNQIERNRLNRKAMGFANAQAVLRAMSPTSAFTPASGPWP
jgi:hypothetical protein